MNRTKLSLVFLYLFVFSSGLLAQFTHVGAGANYGSWIKELGVSGYCIYTISGKIDIVPNGTYFWPHKVNVEFGTNEFTWWTVNMDGHYVVLEKNILQIFGLMGLNYTNEVKRIEETIQGQVFKDKITTNKLGLNIGAGLQLPVSKYFIPFTEVKYTLGERHQFGLCLGILFRIAPDKIREEME
jgi:outer membrane immunogenic protein